MTVLISGAKTGEKRRRETKRKSKRKQSNKKGQGTSFAVLFRFRKRVAGGHHHEILPQPAYSSLAIFRRCNNVALLSLYLCQSTVAFITLRVFHKTKKCHYCCIHGPLFKLWRHRGESGQLFSLRLIDPSHAQNISLPKTLSPPQVFFTLSYTSSSPKAESLEILRKWCAWFVIVESLFWH